MPVAANYIGNKFESQQTRNDSAMQQEEGFLCAATAISINNSIKNRND